jgi:hypothetical protein
MSFPLFVLATVHGFTTGADARNLAVQWLALTGGLFVFLLVSFRLLAPRRRAGVPATPRAEVARPRARSASAQSPA